VKTYQLQQSGNENCTVSNTFLYCFIEFFQSVIIPVYNGSKWIDACLQSVVSQTFQDKFQVCIYNDGSQVGK
jgi:hypothetical protein